MSETVSAPAEGGAAPAIAESTAATEALNNVPEQQPPTAAPEPDRSEQNKWLIAQEREKRRLAKERAEAERIKAEAEAAREEAKKLRETTSGEDAQMANLLRSARGNPAKFQELLDASGLTMDDYVRYKVNGGEITPEQQLKSLDAKYADEIKAARDEIKALREEREQEREAAKREQAAKARQDALNYFAGEVANTLKAAPEKYEFTIAFGEEGSAEVLDLIDRAYRERNVRLAPAQAAEMVENVYRKRYELYENTSYHKSKYAPQSTQAAPAAQQPPKAKTPDAKPRTASHAALTNNAVTSPVTPGDEPSSLESKEAFLARAKKKLEEAEKAKVAARK